MYKFIFSIAVIGLGIYSGCTTGQTAGTKLSATEFSQKITETPEAVIVDVRTPEEYSNSHLEQAENINWYNSDFEQKIMQLDTAKPVFVYCKSGGRSSSAVQKMQSLGFTKIYELKGGITEWRENDLPEVKE